MRHVAAVVLSLALVSPAHGTVRNWTGTTSGVWSVASNWGGTAPVAGDDLVFANTNFANALNNDFAAGTAFNSLTFNAAGTFSPQGNSINLGAGGITQTSGTTLNSFLPLVLTAPQTWSASSPGSLTLNGPASLALGNNLLTMNGNGAVNFSGNTITGTGGISLSGPTLTVTGNLNSTGPINVAGGSHLVLSTPAAIATAIVIQNGGFLDDTIGFSGFMNAPLTIVAGGTYNVVINGTAILQYSKVTVNVAPITLGGNLVVTNNIAAALGTVYTIIMNQTGSPVVGTFAGLAEGATFSAGGQTFAISYQTGIAHDVTLTVVPAPSAPTATTGAASAITATGATLNGTVSANGASTTVTFEYGLTNAYGAAGSPVAAAQSPLGGSATNATVSATVSGLSCGTTYHFRVDANNGIGGIINGTDQTFTTAACAPAPTASAVPTLSQWMVALLALLVAAIAVVADRRRRSMRD